MKRLKRVDDAVMLELEQEQQWHFIIRRCNAFLEYMRTADEAAQSRVLMSILEEMDNVYNSLDRFAPNCRWLWAGQSQQVLLIINTKNNRTLFRCGLHAIPPPLICDSYYSQGKPWLQPSGKFSTSKLCLTVISRAWDLGPTFHVNHIPVDVWQLIMSFLPSCQDLIHCRLVCRRFYKAATKRDLWRPYLKQYVSRWYPYNVPAPLDTLAPHLQLFRMTFQALAPSSGVHVQRRAINRIVTGLLTPRYRALLIYMIYSTQVNVGRDHVLDLAFRDRMRKKLDAWNVYYFDQQMASKPSPLPDVLRVSKTCYTFSRPFIKGNVDGTKRTTAHVVVCNGKNQPIALMRKYPASNNVRTAPAQLIVLGSWCNDGIRFVWGDSLKNWYRFYKQLY